MDFRRALLVLRRWWPLLIAGTVVAAGAAYAVSKALPKVYDATAIVQVNPGIGTVGGGLDFNEVQATWAEANKVAQLIHTNDVAQAAIDHLNRTGALQQPIDAGTLLKNTKALPGSQLGIVTLDVRAGTPNDASNLANTIVSSFIVSYARQQTAGFNGVLTRINQKIAFYSADNAVTQAKIDSLAHAGAGAGAGASAGATTPGKQALNGVIFQHQATDQAMLWQLQQQADGIELHMAGAGNTLAVAQQATPPTTWVSPRTSINTLVAALLALLALLGLVFLIDAVDDRPRDAAEVAIALDAPLLGTISPAPRGASALAMLDQSGSAQADEYRTLRVGLESLVRDANADGAITLAVTGVRPGVGASTVAVNLAAAAARSGRDVVLVDANTRRPVLHTLFSLPDQAGLAEALRDDADPLTLLRETRLPHLRVLAAGHASAEAIDLLGSARMRDVLAVLHAAGHLVVVDTAPADQPDAALATTTLLVAQLHEGHAPALAQAGGRVRQAGARLAGVAVTLYATPATRRAPTAVGLSGASEPANRTGLRSAK